MRSRNNGRDQQKGRGEPHIVVRGDGTLSAEPDETLANAVLNAESEGTQTSEPETQTGEAIPDTAQP